MNRENRSLFAPFIFSGAFSVHASELIENPRQPARLGETRNLEMEGA